jgi:hypothetical protein
MADNVDLTLKEGEGNIFPMDDNKPVPLLAYRSLVETVGKTCYSAAGCEAHGIHAGVEVAMRCLGYEWDVQRFHLETMDVENRLWNGEHPDG